MKKVENIIYTIIFGSVLPLLFCQLAIVIWFYLDKNTSRVLLYLFDGLLPGLVLDLFFLKRWVRKKYELPVWLMAVVYIFFNIEIFGVFMGFPVFTLIMGIWAGYYYGRRLQEKSVSEVEIPGTILKVSLFTGAVMVVNCIASATIALAGNGVGKDIQSMFGLGFEVTKPMLLAVSLLGGVLLVLLQIWLTKITILKVMERKKRFY